MLAYCAQMTSIASLTILREGDLLILTVWWIPVRIKLKAEQLWLTMHMNFYHLLFKFC